MPPPVTRPRLVGSCRRPRPARAGRFDERGFTLVELLMTLTVLAIAVFGTAQVFHGTLRSSAVADARAQATALASREVEGLQAIPYGELGFSSTQLGFRATFEGKDTVEVAAPQSTPLGDPDVIDGITFSIRRDIVWADASDGTADAFKQVIATVTWTDDGGTHEVRADAAVYAIGWGAGGGAVSTTTTTAATPPGAPTGLTATRSTTNPMTQIDLAWTAGFPVPATWQIQYSTNGGTTWINETSSHPGTDNSYSSTGLSDATTYSFRVRGVNAAGSSAWSPTASATTGTSADPCTMFSATASPSPVQKKTNNRLWSNVILEVNTTGSACATLQAVITTSPGNSYTITFTKSGSYYSHTIGHETYSTWSTGNKTIPVKKAATGEQIATLSLTVTN